MKCPPPIIHYPSSQSRGASPPIPSCPGLSSPISLWCPPPLLGSWDPPPVGSRDAEGAPAGTATVNWYYYVHHPAERLFPSLPRQALKKHVFKRLFDVVASHSRAPLLLVSNPFFPYHTLSFVISPTRARSHCEESGGRIALSPQIAQLG